MSVLTFASRGALGRVPALRQEWVTSSTFWQRTVKHALQRERHL
jgi:hypothetical protein